MSLLYPAFAVLGVNLLVLSGLMLLPLALDLAGHAPNVWVFVRSAAITAVAGFSLGYLCHNQVRQLTTQKVFLITAVNWIGVSLFTALPWLVEIIRWVGAAFLITYGVFAARRALEARVRELFGTMTVEGVKAAWFVSPMGFSPEARQYAQEHRILLMDTEQLLEQIRAVPPILLPKILAG